MTSKTLALLFLLVLAFGVPVAFGGEANVFIYHRFGDDRFPSTNIGLEVFAAQLAHLEKERYTVLPLGEIVERLRKGVALPERCAAITVDDAYRTFLSGAMPLLRRHGFPATLFVNTDAVGGEEYLSWEQLRSLEGIEIGNHSASHEYLVELRGGETEEEWRERVRADILLAQEVLHDRLGIKPRLFAYPYGEYSPQLADVVRSLGFSAAAAQQSGVASPSSDLFALPRFPMGGPFATLEGFAEKLRTRALPVRVLSPGSPVLRNENPPVLTVQIGEVDVDLNRLRCFVPGQEEALITADGKIPGRFTIRAAHPLEERRSKYTLTAPSRDGSRWYWFSQLWINLR